LATFSRLGAAPWAHRAETELSAIGVRARLRASSVAERLTAQELQVAVVVAEGVTNAEAAAQLFLSPKTIEFHLSNVYRKLEVRSRTALARKLLTGLPDEALSGDATAGETTPAPDAVDPAAEAAR
jgi:DNA-binding CsgD family transcriptional regulator